MKKRLLLSLATAATLGMLVLVSCGTFSRKPVVLHCDMEFSAAVNMLLAAGARELRSGIQHGPTSEEKKCITKFYLLPDSTCLQLLGEYPKEATADKAVLASIEIGEKGKGYGDKLAWLEQVRQECTRVNISQFMAASTPEQAASALTIDAE